MTTTPGWRPTRAPREQVAYHEAAHAVVALLSGVYVPDSEMVLDDHQAASIYFRLDERSVALRCREGWSIDETEIVRQRCFVAAAGYAADLILAERQGRAFDEPNAFAGAHGDVQDVHEAWGGAHFLKYVNALVPQIRNPEVWALIEALARGAIESRRALYADEVLTVLLDSGAGERVPFRLFRVPDDFPARALRKPSPSTPPAQ